MFYLELVQYKFYSFNINEISYFEKLRHIRYNIRVWFCNLVTIKNDRLLGSN